LKYFKRIDELGRIVLPKELCRKLGFSELTTLEIVISNDTIILEKHTNSVDDEELYNKEDISVCETIDTLNRITLPRNIRETLHINLNETLAISDELGKISIKKKNPSKMCSFCKCITTHASISICENCLNELLLIFRKTLAHTPL